MRALLNSLTGILEYLILQLLDPKLAIRLISIGIYPGKIIKLHRKAPWGGSYYVQVDQSFFALRKNEWETILTKPLDLK